MQLNSQYPCPQSSIPSVAKHQPVIEHGSNRKNQAQNRQQVALSSEDSSKNNKNVNYTSRSKRIVSEPIVGEANDAYRHMTTNLAKQAMVGNDLANDLCGIMSHPSYRNLKNAHPETLVVQADAEDKDRKDEKALGNYGLDDKVWVFKFALAEFLKEINNPFWKEDRLSKKKHTRLW
ncbi:hypothetical protein HPP92_014120 [Vanilla planifolia]|uniref:Uncharacterized protein n=1 Tax=Vanilla planifolia TaxID=51239 RepID=A0A835UVE5_VANPL|nr:hypothetical protein HPP92_014120 [Vanilla planifolia]